MNPNAMLAGAITIAFITAAAPGAQADAGSKDARHGGLRTDFTKPQVKCYRRMFAGKDSCKGKDDKGYIVDGTTNEFDSHARYFTTDAQTCHAAGLSTKPRRG